MTLAVFSIVLLAAFLHALWNALVKAAGDRAVTLGLVALGHTVPATLLLPFVEAPALAALPYIVASTVIHWGYYFFLNASYRFGDLSLVYPVARGLAPVLVALGAVVTVGETLPVLAWIGILTVSSGILVLAVMRHADGRGIWAAVTTSLFIATYSIVDGIGIRVSGAPLGYVVWLFVAEVFVVLFVIATRWRRARALSATGFGLGLLGGVISGLAYGLSLYAKTLAPLGIVSALRETSVIFAALIGVIWMKEGPAPRRVLAAAIVASGVGLLAIS